MVTASADLIVSVSGIRGIIGGSLTPDVAARFAAAFGSTVGGSVLVSRDSRPSGDMLRHAVTSGLMAAGRTVLDIGVAPTPTVGVAVRRLNAGGAIQITASHNPSPWNGLKMFGPDGAVLPAAAGRRVKELFESGGYPLAGWDGIGGTSVPPDVLVDHADAARDLISVAGVAARRFRVFVDGNGGAGGPLATRLLSELGCEVVEHHCGTDGVFAHDPEPTPAHLVDVAPWVTRTESAVGFVLDPDADRLALIDETGTCISEELTLALAVKHRLREKKGPVVVNMSSSRVVQDLAEQAGCAFHRSAVGEANVVEKMRAVDAVLGGEGNGGVIDPRVGWVRDPFAGMAMILALLADEGKPLSEVVAGLPKYAMVKTKFTVSKERLADALAKLPAAFPGMTANTIDGLRLDGPDGWVHVRGSNTEPVVRVIAEARDEAAANELATAAGRVLTG